MFFCFFYFLPLGLSSHLCIQLLLESNLKWTKHALPDYFSTVKFGFFFKINRQKLGDRVSIAAWRNSESCLSSVGWARRNKSQTFKKKKILFQSDKNKIYRLWAELRYNGLLHLPVLTHPSLLCIFLNKKYYSIPLLS